MRSSRALLRGFAGTGGSTGSRALDVRWRPTVRGTGRHGWYAPELLRIKGEVLLQQAPTNSLGGRRLLTRRPNGPTSRALIVGSCGPQ